MNVAITLVVGFTGVLGLLYQLTRRIQRIKEEEELKESKRPSSVVYRFGSELTPRTNQIGEEREAVMR